VGGTAELGPWVGGTPHRGSGVVIGEKDGKGGRNRQSGGKVVESWVLGEEKSWMTDVFSNELLEGERSGGFL